LKWADDPAPIEFAGLPIGEYLVHVEGVCERRPARNWQRPAGRPPNEVPVGSSEWQRPVEVHLCHHKRVIWKVTNGDCRDSLVVTIKGAAWVPARGPRVGRVLTFRDREWEALGRMHLAQGGRTKRSGN